MELDVLDNNSQTDLPEDTLAESESVRQIKEEWTRLQVEADGLKTQLLQDARAIRQGQPQLGPFIRGTEATRGGPVNWQNVHTLPRSNLPSLHHMNSIESAFPSINIRSSLRKNVFETGSLGSHLDIDMEPKEVERPQHVGLTQTAFLFGADTPTQTEIRWTPPSNAELFRLLMYNIEADFGQGWLPLTESHLPILRVYFTSEKIILGRFSRTQEAQPVGIRLRICAMGRVKTQTGEETVKGPWSDEIWLTIEGSEVTSNTAV